MTPPQRLNILPIKLSWAGLLLIAIPLLNSIKFNVGGELFASEIVTALIAAILILNNSQKKITREKKLLIILCIFWLVGQIVTDIYRGTPTQDFIKGWSKITFFLLSYIAFSRLLINDSRVFYLLIGTSIYMMIRPWQTLKSTESLNVFWKYGLGSGVLFTIFTLALTTSLRKNIRKASAAFGMLSLIFGLISLYLNARSFGGLALVLGAIFFTYGKLKNDIPTNKQIALSFAAIIVIGLGTLQIYASGASSGFFGEEARQKYEYQVSGSGGLLSVLLGGRTEILVSTIAIYDSPILGHGSWAKDFHYTKLLNQFKADLSEAYIETGESLSNGLIPTHSYLFGSWVEAGFFGGVFWLYILSFFQIKLIRSIWQRRNHIGLITLALLPSFVWNVLFSPFGSNIRIEVAAILSVFTYTIAKTRKHYHAI